MNGAAGRIGQIGQHQPLPAKKLIIVNPRRNHLGQLPCRPEMNEFGRRQAQKPHRIIMESLPDLLPAPKQLLADPALGRLLIILLQRRVLCERIQKIPIKTKPCRFIHKARVFFFIDSVVSAD